MADDRIDVSLRLGIDKASQKKVEKQVENTKKKLESSERYKIQLGLSKSLQKQEKENAKDLALQEKALKKANAEREKALRFEQSVRKQLEKIDAQEAKRINKQKQQTANLKTQLSIFKEQQARQISSLKTSFGENIDSGRLSQFEKSVSSLNVNTPDLQNKMKMLNSEFKNIKHGASEAANQTRTLSGTIVDAAGKFGLWIGISSVVFGAISAVKDLVNQVKLLDDALLELSKTSDLSTSELSAFADEAAVVGKKINESAASIIRASADFTRMGFSPEESLRLAEDSVILTKIADGINDVNEASTAMIAILKGFNLEASQSGAIIDKINEVSNNFAINTDDLADGLRRVGAVMSQNGTTIDETIGLLVGAQQGLQNIEKVSSGLITISTRLLRVKEGVDDIEGLTVKLGDAFDTYTQGRVKIENMDGSLRSTYDILIDLASVWDTLTPKAQSYLGFLVSGTRQSPVLNQLMSDLQGTIDATGTSMNSAGSASIELEKAMDSLQGKLNAISATWSRIATNALNSETVGIILDITNAFLGLIEQIGLLPSLLIGISEALLLIKGEAVILGIASLAESIGLVGTASAIASVSVGTLATALGGIGLILAGVSAVWQAYKRDVDQARKAQEDFEKGTENLKRILEIGTKEEVEAQIDVLKELASEYSNLESQADSLNQKYIDLINSGVSPMSGEARNLKLEENALRKEMKELEFQLDDYGATSKTVNHIILELAHRTDKLREESEKLSNAQSEALTSTQLLEKALVELNSIGEVSTSTFSMLLEKFPELAEEISINEQAVKDYTETFENSSNAQLIIEKELTNQKIEETKNRIKALSEELSAIQEVVKAESTRLGRPQDDTLRSLSANQIAMRESLSALDDLFSKGKAIDVVQSERNKTTKKSKKETKELTEQEKALLDVEQRIAMQEKLLARTQGEDRIPILEKLKQLEFERNNDLQDLKDSLDEAELSEDEYTEAINRHTLAQEDATNKQVQYDEAIKETAKTIREDIKKATEDSIKELKSISRKELEDFKEKEKEKKEIAIRELKDRLEEQELLLKELNREEKEEDFLSEKEKIEKQISDLEAEQLGLREAKGAQSAFRRFEIEQELIVARGNLEELESARSTELKRQEIQDKKESINEEIEAEEDKYDRLINEAEDYYESLIDKIESFEGEWENLGEDAGYEFASAFEDELEDLIDQLNEITGASISKPSGSGSRTISGGKYGRPVTVDDSDIVRVRDKETGREGTIHKNTLKKDPDRFQRLNTGGVIKTEGLVHVHPNEPVLNPAQTANVVGALGMPNSSPLANAKNLFNFANNIPNISPINNASSSNTATIDININNPVISDDIGLQKLTTQISRSIRDTLPTSGISIKPVGA